MPRNRKPGGDTQRLHARNQAGILETQLPSGLAVSAKDRRPLRLDRLKSRQIYYPIITTAYDPGVRDYV